MQAYLVKKPVRNAIPRLTDLPVPEPGPKQYLVRISYAGINPVDWKVMRSATLARILGVRFPLVPGFDFAGTICGVGRQANQFREGDRVMGMVLPATDTGSFSEYAVVSAGAMVSQPQGWDEVRCAALPLAGLTAWQAVHERTQSLGGGKILILGGSSAVGFMAAHIAAEAGMEVTMVASSRNQAWLGQSGHWQTHSYESPFPKQWINSFALVFDAVAKYGWWRSKRWLSKGGTYLTTVPNMSLMGHRLLRTLTGSLLSKEGIYTPVRPKREDLADLVQFVSAHPSALRIEHVFQFEKLEEALHRSAGGRSTGKLVLKVGGTAPAPASQDMV